MRKRTPHQPSVTAAMGNPKVAIVTDSCTGHVLNLIVGDWTKATLFAYPDAPADLGQQRYKIDETTLDVWTVQR